MDGYLFMTADFIKSTWSVHSFNGDYLSKRTGGCEYLFREMPNKRHTQYFIWICYNFVLICIFSQTFLQMYIYWILPFFSILSLRDLK